MTDNHKRGHTFQADFAALLSDTTKHDLTIVCADGVEIGACRAILAARSDVFNAMLYGNMSEANSNKISLPDIESDVMRVVLRFIYTEEIIAIPSMYKVYLAADFLILHRLKELILDRYIVTCNDDDHPNDISFDPIPYSLAEMVLDAPDVDNTIESRVFDNLVLASLRLGFVSKLLLDHQFHVNKRHAGWMEKADDTPARIMLTKFLNEQEVDTAYGEWIAEQEENPGGPTSIKKRQLGNEPIYPVKLGRCKRQN